MTQTTEKRLYMSAHGIRTPIGPDEEKVRSYHECLVRTDYDLLHPGDTFDCLKHRAQFSKFDQGLLRDWMAVAAVRAQQRDKDVTSESWEPSMTARRRQNLSSYVKSAAGRTSRSEVRARLPRLTSALEQLA